MEVNSINLSESQLTIRDCGKELIHYKEKSFESILTKEQKAELEKMKAERKDFEKRPPKFDRPMPPKEYK